MGGCGVGCYLRGCRGCLVSWLLLAPLFQALEKKGISHLDEKDLKERNKRIQEDNRLELQKVGPEAPSLPLSGTGPHGQPSSPSRSQPILKVPLISLGEPMGRKTWVPHCADCCSGLRFSPWG